jgi:hypothetical protein
MLDADFFRAERHFKQATGQFQRKRPTPFHLPFGLNEGIKMVETALSRFLWGNVCGRTNAGANADL